VSPRDVNLQLADAATPITATGQATEVDTEGGFYAIARFEVGDPITDANETFDFLVMASIDGGSNYFQIGAIRQIVDGDEDLIKSIPVYVPRFPPATQTVTKVRLEYVVAGTTPSLLLNCWLEPMVSLGVPAIDEGLNNGLAELS